MTENSRKFAASARPRATSPGGPCLLLVEPDALTHWSLATYLQNWFTVRSVTSHKTARSVLDSEDVVAAVISDRIPIRAAKQIVSAVRHGHGDARVVMMVTGETEIPEGTLDAAIIEKPFELAVLARLLGVTEIDAVSA